MPVDRKDEASWLSKGLHHDLHGANSSLNRIQADLRGFGIRDYSFHEDFRRKGPYDEMQFILRGKGSLRIGRRTLSFNAPALVLLSFNEETGILNQSGLLKFFFHLNITWGPSDLLYGEEPLVKALPPAALPPLSRLMGIVKDKDVLAAKGALWDGLSLAREELGAVLQRKAPRFDYDEPFFRYVQDTGVNDFSLGSIAQVYRVTPGHFSAQFKAAHGLSAKQFFLEAKIRQAKQRLADPDLTLSRLAEDLGYGDAFHFSKSFKKSTGFSPRDYRIQSKAERH